MRRRLAILTALTAIASQGFCATVAGNGAGIAQMQSRYVWTALPFSDTAQLVTLTCRDCYGSYSEGRDIPLLAVLKDTLGDQDPENDRLSSVWLLGYAPPSVARRALSAVPFFYMRVGADRNVEVPRKKVSLAPQIDLVALQHPVVNTLGRDVLQWMMFDQIAMPVRATSRAYRTNEVDHERLALEEAISYLRAASDEGPNPVLSTDEISTLLARLELRKTLLGGFVTGIGAKHFAQQDASEHERVRSRNWELLRQYADKAGLYFEPLELAGTSGEYAMLWVPVKGWTPPLNATHLNPIWKLLNLRRPSAKDLDKLSMSAAPYARTLDSDGNLLPEGAIGSSERRLVPLAAYSLNYPTMPLLMVDFRGGQHMRWRAMTQRSINEITAGVIGISHFTNWYYYVAADLYDFVAARHGAAMNQAERLDCYSQFRVTLALDRTLDARLRKRMRQQVEALSMNPLETSPEAEISVALARSSALTAAAQVGALNGLVDRNRRAEIVLYSASQKRVIFDSVLHLASFGTYTHRASRQQLSSLDTLRRTETQLVFLDRATDAGTQPEVAFASSQIQSSLAELRELLPQVTSRQLRAHAVDTISRVQSLSKNQDLRAECDLALGSLQAEAPSPAIALRPRAATFNGQAHTSGASQ